MVVRVNQKIKCFLVVSLLFFCSLIFVDVALAEEKIGVINEAIVNIRSGPSTNYQIVTKVKQGDKVNILTEKEQWYKVRLSNGKEGWVANWLIRIANISSNKKVESNSQLEKSGTIAIVNTDVANVRSGPGTTYNRVKQAFSGQAFNVLKQNGEWYQIEGNGINNGWIAGWLLEIKQQPLQQVKAKLIVHGKVVNIRSGPDTSYSIIEKVQQGEELVQISKKEDWFKVKTLSGKEGWVADWLVSTKSESVPSRGQGSTTESQDNQIRPKDEIFIPLSGTTEAKLIYSDDKLRLVIEGLISDQYEVVNIDGHNEDGKILVKFDAKTNISVKENINKWGLSSFWVSPYESKAAIELVFNENQVYQASYDEKKKKLVIDFSNVTKPATITSVGVNNNSFTIKGDNKLTGRFEKIGNNIIKLHIPYAKLDINNIKKEWLGLNSVLKNVKFNEGEEGVEAVFEISSGAQYTLVTNNSEISVVVAQNQGRLSGRIIVLDPGHGSIKNGFSDPGAVGPTTRLYERDIVLDIALQVKERLVAQGATVIMTRTGSSTNLTLQGRAQIANDIGAEIFVSIHANASTKGTYNGTSTYFYAPRSHEILASQRLVRQRLASSVQRGLVNNGGRIDLGIMEANFAVLRETTVPSILVETAFISNPEEEKLFTTNDFRARLASGIVEGIEDFFL